MNKLFRFVLLVLLCSASVSYTLAQDSNQKNRDLPVMTRNMDAGSDFGYILAAATDPNSTPTDMLIAISKTFVEMHSSNYAARADRVAAEIQATQPYLVGLQEVTTLRTGSYPGPATTVVDNQMQRL